VDLVRSEVVTFNDEVGQNHDVQKMTENVLGVNSEAQFCEFWWSISYTLKRTCTSRMKRYVCARLVNSGSNLRFKEFILFKVNTLYSLLLLFLLKTEIKNCSEHLIAEAD